MLETSPAPLQFSGSIVGSINIVILCRVWLVLGMDNHPWVGRPPVN